MKASPLKGMSVLSIREGTRLGTVEDLVVDSAAGRIAALVIQSGASGRLIPSPAAERRLVPFDGVRSIGEDAITVDSTQVVAAANEQNPLAALPNLGSVLGLKVVDEAGTLLGEIEDLEIDPERGRITGLLVHHGGVLGMGGNRELLPAAAVRSLGPDVVMVEPSSTRPIEA
jgi:sporulation protein YlmC with PRC-barrel domain